MLIFENFKQRKIQNTLKHSFFRYQVSFYREEAVLKQSEKCQIIWVVGYSREDAGKAEPSPEKFVVNESYVDWNEEE